MEIPAALYGDYDAVAKRCRRAIRSYLRGEQGLWDALASDGMIDTAGHTGAIAMEGADPLWKEDTFFRCGLPLYLLLNDISEWLTSAQEEDIFASGIETTWGLLCMFDRQAIPEDVMVSEEMSAAMHADDPATVQRLIEAGEPVDRADLALLRSPLL